MYPWSTYPWSTGEYAVPKNVWNSNILGDRVGYTKIIELSCAEIVGINAQQFRYLFQ